MVSRDIGIKRLTIRRRRCGKHHVDVEHSGWGECWKLPYGRSLPSAGGVLLR